MSDMLLVSSICLSRVCYLIYRSTDGLIGLALTSSSGRQDRRRYFVWALPDSAPDYATAAEARAHVLDPPRQRRKRAASSKPPGAKETP